MIEFKLPGQKEITPEAAETAAPVEAATSTADTGVTPPAEAAVPAQETPGMPPLETAVVAGEVPQPPAGLVETPQVQPAAESTLPSMHSNDEPGARDVMLRQAAQQFPSLGQSGEAASDAAPDFVQPAAFTPALENEAGVGAGLLDNEEEGGDAVATGNEEYVQPALNSEDESKAVDEEPEMPSLASTESKSESLYSDIEQEFAVMTESNAVVARFTELLFEEYPPRLTKLRVVVKAASNKAVELHDHMAAYHFQMTLQNYELLASNQELMTLLNEANTKQQ